ncbi:MAG: hypothetical protein H7237_01120 [Alkalinema sp. FL-bin-369]|nr:hypothetical protein [Leptolyngbyaceae cyanobacterium LF-bin-369]
MTNAQFAKIFPGEINWDLDSDEAKHMRDRGGRNLALRTYNVTDDHHVPLS